MRLNNEIKQRLVSEINIELSNTDFQAFIIDNIITVKKVKNLDPVLSLIREEVFTFPDEFIIDLKDEQELKDAVLSSIEE